MNKFLEELSNDEHHLIEFAPIYVSLLIAGADGNIDNAEISNAIKISKEKAKKSETFLIELYTQLETNFEEKLDKILNEVPSELTERNAFISQMLERLNPVLAKMDKTFSITYYSFLKEVATRVAKASGGVFGINAVSSEEKEFIDLPMISDPAIIFRK
jgi:DNA anti-recombination protein RmuC